MSSSRIILAATAKGLARAESIAGEWSTSFALKGVKINCIEVVPGKPGWGYVGTQHEGIFATRDAGLTWEKMGMQGIPIKSLAVDPQSPKLIYAGGKPVSLYKSTDGGASWCELDAMRDTRRWWWFSPADPPGITPYVSGLAVSPVNHNVILAGIELGAVMRTEDGGKTWSRHMHKSYRDCHSLKFHFTNGDWAYEGGGGGVSFSRDGGKSWLRDKKGLGSKYGWWVAADPGEEDIWYLSASEMPNLFRGEFNPPAHQDGAAKAQIFRKKGNDPWVQLSGGLPEPLDYMAYSLITLSDSPGIVYAGLANGQVWQSTDYGEEWNKLNLDLGDIHTAMCVLDQPN